METREITKGYLQLFVKTIQDGNPVTFVEADNLLAVAHPLEGYLVLEIADTVVEDG